MSATVENRVVSMEFDNKDFERNVATSIQTLDKLDKSLKFDNAEDSFNKITQSANRVSLDHIENALDKITSRFTVFGKVIDNWKQTIANAITNTAKSIYNNTIGQIQSGGWNRAMNIENAKFQLEGLGIAWKDVYESISYAVDGTAYGLDSAAKAASQLAASGVELGQDMSDSLRAISGVAAMTNSSYDDIAAIFTTVAGQGRVMGDQLNQMASKGLNAAATLAKSFGTTEEELRKMVSKGQVSFKDFAKAMDDAFGEHAKDANKTFEGVLSNIRAALSKIGADFATPILTKMVEPLNVLRETINNVKKAMVDIGVYEIWNAIVQATSDITTSFGNALNQTTIIQNTVQSFFNLLAVLANVLLTIGDGISRAFPLLTLENINRFIESVKNFTNTLIISRRDAYNLSNTMSGLGSVFNLLGVLIGKAVYVLSPLGKVIAAVASAILEFTGRIGYLITNLVNYITQSEMFNSAFESMHDAVDKFADGAVAVIEKLVTFIEPALEIIISLVLIAATKILEFITTIMNAAQKMTFSEFIEAAFNKVKNVITGFLSFIGVNYKPIEEFFNGFRFPSFQEAVNILSNTFNLLKEKFKDFVSSFSGESISFGKIVENIGNFLLKGATRISEFVSTLVNSIDTSKLKDIGFVVLMTLLVTTLTKSVRDITKSGQQLIESVTHIFDNVSGVIGSIGKVFDSVSDAIGAFQNKMNSEAIKNIAEAIAILAGTIGILVLALTKVPTEELSVALAATIVIVTQIMVLMGIVVATFALLNKFNAQEQADSLKSLAIALGTVSAAVLILGKMPITELAKGLGSVILLLSTLCGWLYILNDNEVSVKGTQQLILLAIALDALIPLINVFSKFSAGQVAAVLVSMAGILAEVAGFCIALDKLDITILGENVLAIMGLVLALDMLIPAMVTFGMIMKPTQLAQALITLGLLLTAFGTFAYILDGAQLISVGVGIMALAAAIDMLIPPILIFGTIPWQVLGVGLLGVAGALVALGVTAAVLSPLAPAVLAIGAGLLSLSAAVTLTVVAIGLLGPALISLSAGLVALNATGKTVGKEFGENVSNIIIGLAEAVEKGAPAIVGAVVRTIASCLAAIAENAPSIMESILTILINIAFTIGKGIPLIIAAVIAGLASAVQAIIDSNSQFNIATGGILQTIVKAIGDGIIMVGKGFKDLAIAGWNELKNVDWFQLGKDIVSTIINAIKEETLAFVNLGKMIVEGFTSGINGNMSAVGSAGYELAEAGITGLEKGADVASPSKKAMKVGEFVLEGFIQGLEKDASKTNDAGKALGSGVINGLSDDANASLASNAGQSIVANFLDALKDDEDKASSAGSDVTSGFISGIGEMADKAVNAAKDLGLKAIEGLRDGIDAHSDSVPATGGGHDVGSGLGNGMDDMGSFVFGKAKDLGNTAIDGLINTVGDATGVKDAAGGMMNTFTGGLNDKIPDVNGAITNITSNMGTTLQNTMPDGEATGGGFGSGVFSGISNWIPDIESVTGNLKGLLGNYDSGAAKGAYDTGYFQGQQFYYGASQWEGPMQQLAARMKSYLAQVTDAYVQAKNTVANLTMVTRSLNNLGKETSGVTSKIQQLAATATGKAADKALQRTNKIQAAIDKTTQRLAQLESQTVSADDALANLGSGKSGGGGGGGSGGSGGSGGGGGSSATKEKEEEIKELFDVMEDAEGVVNRYAERFVLLDEEMEESDGINIAKEKIENFANAILIASDKYTEEIANMDTSSEEYLAAMQEAWDEYHDSLEQALTGSIDMFSEFKYTAETDSDSIVKSINSQTEALNLFDRTVAVLAQDANISPHLLEELVNGGVSNLGKLIALLDTTEEKRKAISDAYDTLNETETTITNRIMSSLAASISNYSEAVEKALEDSDTFQNAMDKMSKSSEETQIVMYSTFKDTYNKLDDIIDLGKNIWVEYEDAEKKSKKALMKNLDEQTKQWQAWADGLNEVIAKGLDEAVVKNLMNMGLDAMPYIRGFKDMTEEEMSDYNEKFTGLATIKQTMQAELAGNYTAVAKNIVDSFKDGIDTSAAEESGKELVDNTVNAIQEALGDKAKYQGTILATAYDEGFKENSDFVQDTVKQFSEDLLQNLEIDYNDLHDIGKNIMEGLADGLEDNADIVTDKLSDLVDDMISEVEDGFDIGSPSKVMRRLGQFIDQGLAMGVDDESKGVISSIKDMGNDAYQSMKAIVDYILDILNGETKADLTLTPVLDLDEFYTGIDDMNGMLQTTSKNNLREASRISPYYSTGQYGVNGNTTNNSNTININVYGDGMNASEIADEVQNRINHQIRRLGAVS